MAQTDAFTEGRARLHIDLSEFIRRPGQYVLRFDDLGKTPSTVRDIAVRYDGRSVHDGVLSALKQGEVYLLNRQAQIVDESRIALDATLESQAGGSAEVQVLIKPLL